LGVEGSVTIERNEMVELASLVADELEARGLAAGPRRLVDAGELASLLGVKRNYVYEHAAQLGAVRLGDGPRARLRFDPEEAAARVASCHAVRESNHGEPAREAGKPRRPRRRLGTRTPLLPIRGVIATGIGSGTSETEA
jgi:hypothetical protein